MAVKNFALATLASSFKSARKGAAQAVSAIALIELPNNQWDDIIDNLARNATNEVPEYKMSSLETLWYICEELTVLPEVEVDKILYGLMTNLQPTVTDDNIRLLAVTALSFCLRLCEKNFKIQVERDALINCIIENCKSTNSQIRMKAVQCLLEVVRCFYNYIEGTILEKIAGTTYNSIKFDNTEEVSLLAIEVWCSICDEEIFRLQQNTPRYICKNYIRLVKDSLLPLLLDCLKKKDNDSDSDWNLSIASACCISLMAQILKDDIVDPILGFISENLSSDKWPNRDAALLSFAGILKGPDKAKLNQLILQALGALCLSLKDTKNQVRETAAWTFARLADDFADLLVDNIKDLLNPWLEALVDKPKISNQICFMFHNLVENMKIESEETNRLSPYLERILQSLWVNAFRSDAFADNVNLANSSLAAFSNIVQYSAADTQRVIVTVMRILLEEFGTIIKGAFRIPEKMEEYQNCLCSTMQAVFIKLTGKIPAPVATSIVEMLLEAFRQRKAVFEEAMIAFSGLIIAVGKDFIPHMKNFGSYLTLGLKAYEQTTLCRVSVGCVADLARTLEETMSEYLNELMPILMELLRSSDTDRGVKLVVISVISDLALQTGRFFIVYLKDVLDIFKSASEVAVQPVNDEDPELPIYFEQLKESLVESYTGLVIGAKDVNEAGIFRDYVQGIFSFLAVLSQNIEGMKFEQLKGICGLIGDLTTLMGPHLKEYLSAPFIGIMIKRLEQSPTENDRNVAMWVNKEIIKAFK
jgi:importin subunit beta-1